MKIENSKANPLALMAVQCSALLGIIKRNTSPADQQSGQPRKHNPKSLTRLSRKNPISRGLDAKERRKIPTIQTTATQNKWIQLLFASSASPERRPKHRSLE